MIDFHNTLHKVYIQSKSITMNLQQKISQLFMLLVLIGVATIMHQCTSNHNNQGVYSVSNNTKVCFSKGNLQYQASTGKWRFAEHQWDIIGDANRYISLYDIDWIDLFGWGTGNNPTKSLINSDNYSGSFYDWGNNHIINGDNKTWYTLTKDEWIYLFNERQTRSGIRYAKAIVNEINGIILLPDKWNSDIYCLRNTNNYAADYSNNIVSITAWNESFETHGAVFLPAGGKREGSSVKYIGSDGHYWSSTPDGSSYAYYVYFRESNLNPNKDSFKCTGRSIRLVRLAE